MTVLVTAIYSMYTNKLLITDVDVTFDFKVSVYSVSFWYFACLVFIPCETNTNPVKNK